MYVLVHRTACSAIYFRLVPLLGHDRQLRGQAFIFNTLQKCVHQIKINENLHNNFIQLQVVSVIFYTNFQKADIFKLIKIYRLINQLRYKKRNEPYYSETWNRETIYISNPNQITLKISKTICLRCRLWSLCRSARC